MKKSLTLAIWLAGSLLPAATRAEDTPPTDAYLTVGDQVNPDPSQASEASYANPKVGEFPAHGAITQKCECYGLNAQARCKPHLNGRAEWFGDSCNDQFTALLNATLRF